jgi:hypothetical protein
MNVIIVGQEELVPGAGQLRGMIVQILVRISPHLANEHLERIFHICRHFVVVTVCLPGTIRVECFDKDGLVIC